MILALLLLLHSFALALPVLEVPPGASTVTVQLCDRSDGCPLETLALDAYTRSMGLALMDFDTLALAGPGGHTASEAYRQALEQLTRKPGLASAQAARAALSELPFTVPPDDLFRLQLELGRLAYLEGLEAESERALAAAASCSGGRVHDLPPLPESVLERYFDATDAVARGSWSSGTLRVLASGGGQVFVDGRRVGDAPTSVELVPGWHRVTVESTGARTAWAGEIELPADRELLLEADTSPFQGTGDLEATVLGATRGTLPDAATTEPLLRWARARQLRWVRFVALFPAQGFPEGVVEVIPDPDPAHQGWAVRDVWLDVSAGRFMARDAGPSALVGAARPMRFRVGLGLGYARLDPRPGLHLELDTLLRVRRLLALELRVGLLRTPEPIYLYPGWSEHTLLPVAAGLRLGPDRAGPYACLHGLAVVPYALGGVARLGWELAPTSYWRVGLEAGAGLTDQGWLALGGLRLARRY